MGLAVRAFALVIGFGPGLAQHALPGEVIKRLAPGIDTGPPAAYPPEGSALEQDRCRTRERSDAGGARVARAVLAPLRQQPRRQPSPGSWQAGEHDAIGMLGKELLDGLG